MERRDWAITTVLIHRIMEYGFTVSGVPHRDLGGETYTYWSATRITDGMMWTSRWLEELLVSAKEHAVKWPADPLS